MALKKQIILQWSATEKAKCQGATVVQDLRAASEKPRVSVINHEEKNLTNNLKEHENGFSHNEPLGHNTDQLTGQS